MKKLKLALFSLMTFVLASPVYAAVDPDVASTTSAVSSTMKENIISVIDTNVPTLVIIGVIIIGIFFVWRFGKRMVGGR